MKKFISSIVSMLFVSFCFAQTNIDFYKLVEDLDWSDPVVYLMHNYPVNIVKDTASITGQADTSSIQITNVKLGDVAGLDFSLTQMGDSYSFVIMPTVEVLKNPLQMQDVYLAMIKAFKDQYGRPLLSGRDINSIGKGLASMFASDKENEKAMRYDMWIEESFVLMALTNDRKKPSMFTAILISMNED